MSVRTRAAPAWPSLPYDAWRETCETLHMWTQIAGKVRLALSPHINHWWQVPLYVTSRGLTTSAIPHGGRTFQLDFDFVRHFMRIETNDGMTRDIALAPRSVADFYDETMKALSALRVPVKIWSTPVGTRPRMRLGTIAKPWRLSVVRGTNGCMRKHSRLSSRINRNTCLPFTNQP